MAEVAKKKKRYVEEEYEDDDIDFEMEDDDDEDEEEEVRPRKKKKKSKSAKASTIDPMAIAAAKKLLMIKDEIKSKLFERDIVLDDLFRALVAGENILLLGPPGTGKTYLADIFTNHIEDADLFKYMLNRTSDPSNIFGPYSIKEMENDKFVRVTSGMLPEAHIGFIDEIFKGNEPVLNSMLTMLNEGIFHNGGKAVPVELRLMLAASNEYPESDDLDAFYDRFVFRHWVHYVQDPQNRILMASSSRNRKKSLVPPTTITLEEIDALQRSVFDIEFPKTVEAIYDKMYRSLQAQDIRISDRRYAKGQVIMMANALLNGRDKVTSDDFTSLTYMLWNKDVKEIPIIEAELAKFVNPYESKVKELLVKAQEVKTKTLAVENRTERAGEAVSANATMQEIMAKMSEEIKEAKTQGADITGLEKMRYQVEEMMEEIAQECLKQSIRGGKKW